MTYKKKLIEVALPLAEINDASAYDKMPGIGPHPKGIHHWWARLPLPTARAVLFASVVDDPSAHPEKWPTIEKQEAERERLFGILRRMMGKKLHEHPEVYAEAREEMLRHTEDGLPAVFDPFAGGGSIPLEANRLGFEAHAGDLNPVAVLLNKCNLEIAPRWAGWPPVNPKDRELMGGQEAWPGTSGLAADVRYYGRRILDQARAKIGHLYPKVRLPKEHGGGEANVIAWIWARTVASPDPSVGGAHVPLVSTFWLSSKKGKEAWLEPIVDRTKHRWAFKVRADVPKDRAGTKAGTKTGKAQFRCLLTGAPITDAHIKSHGKAGEIGTALLAIVAEGKRGRIYLAGEKSQAETALATRPKEHPGQGLLYDSRYLTPPAYGMETISSLFTPRQLTALVTLSDLVKAGRKEVQHDAKAAGLDQEQASLYAQGVSTFLALAVDRCADFNNALCRWSASNEKVMNLFGRQAIPMIWDHAEANLLGDAVGSWSTCCDYIADCVEVIASAEASLGHARQIDAAAGANGLKGLLVSTDPPYYDNVPYADISDFFYVWLRRTIGDLSPDLFSTLLVPKREELTASPGRFEGDKDKAKEHFESGFHRAFSALQEKMDPRFPLTVYYAFKQSDEESSEDDSDSGGSSRVDLTTGWETLLQALLSSGFQITATWPVRASQAWRMRAMGANALASYIVLACRPKPPSAPMATRREFMAALRKELPPALKTLQHANIAPVDLAQASIGPGMGIFSRFAKVLEADGSSMSVRTALSLINQELDAYLAEQEGEMDADSRFCLAWFEQSGMKEGPFGDADVLARAKNTSVDGIQRAGCLVSKGGKVRLLSREELPEGYDPVTDERRTVWECTQHLIKALDAVGESGAAVLLARLGGDYADQAKALAYRLFAICERRGWAEEALAYNRLITSWGDVQSAAASAPRGHYRQTSFEGA